LACPPPTPHQAPALGAWLIRLAAHHRAPGVHRWHWAVLVHLLDLDQAGIAQEGKAAPVRGQALLDSKGLHKAAQRHACAVRWQRGEARFPPMTRNRDNLQDPEAPATSAAWAAP